MRGDVADQPREALSLQRAARLLDVHEDTLRRWWKSGRIEIIRVGKKLLRVPVSEIRRLRLEGEERDEARSGAALVQGFVYFVESAGLIKIGVTCYLRDRVKTLETQSAHPIRLCGALRYASYDEAKRAELSFHDEFKVRRRHGEWFAIAEADVAGVLARPGSEPHDAPIDFVRKSPQSAQPSR